MSHNTVVARLKIYAAGILTLAVVVGVAGFARDGAEASGALPQPVLVSPEHGQGVAEEAMEAGPVDPGSLQPGGRATERAGIAGVALSERAGRGVR